MRRLGVFLALLGFGFGLGSLHAEPSAQRRAEVLLEQGIAAYKGVELDTAEQRLLGALDALKQAAPGDSKARQLAARVHLQLGRIAVVTANPERAREHFRQALRRAPELRLSGDSDPPKIFKIFEAVRAELAPPEEDLPQSDPRSPPGKGTGSVLFEARLAYEAGVAAYEAMDFAAAQQHLERSAARLLGAEASSPEARELAAKVHLQLGRALAVAGKPAEAKARFREALGRDRNLEMDPKLDPPKVLAIFDAVNVELGPKPSADQPEIEQRKLLLAAACVVLALLIFLGARRRGRRKKPSGPPELGGNWSLTTTLVSNNVGVPNGGTNLERVVVRQTGNDLAIVDGDGSELFHATTEGSSIVFSGSIPDHEGGRHFTRRYSGSGTVSPTLVAGTLQMTVAHDVQTYGFQFQSNTVYDYNLTMTRL